MTDAILNHTRADALVEGHQAMPRRSASSRVFRMKSTASSEVTIAPSLKLTIIVLPPVLIIIVPPPLTDCALTNERCCPLRSAKAILEA